MMTPVAPRHARKQVIPILFFVALRPKHGRDIDQELMGTFLARTLIQATLDSGFQTYRATFEGFTSQAQHVPLACPRKSGTKPGSVGTVEAPRLRWPQESAPPS